MNKKVIIVVLAMSLIGSFLAGCKQDTKQPDNKPSVPTANQNKNAREYIEKTGIYVGQVDSNSVEITIDDQPMVFRLSEELKERLSKNDIDTNKAVKIKYYKNEYGQNELVELLVEDVKPVSNSDIVK